MIQMGVRQHNGVYGGGIDRQRCPVSEAQLFEALKQAAIDENAHFGIFKKIFGAGDGTCRTEKSQFGIHMKTFVCAGLQSLIDLGESIAATDACES